MGQIVRQTEPSEMNRANGSDFPKELVSSQIHVTRNNQSRAYERLSQMKLINRSRTINSFEVEPDENQKLSVQTNET